MEKSRADLLEDMLERNSRISWVRLAEVEKKMKRHRGNNKVEQVGPVSGRLLDDMLERNSRIYLVRLPEVEKKMKRHRDNNTVEQVCPVSGCNTRL